ASPGPPGPPGPGGGTRGAQCPGAPRPPASRASVFRLVGEPEREVGMAAPSTIPSTVCYPASSGILKLTPSPRSSNSIRALPPRPWLTSRSIKVSPNPRCDGLPTGGPPRSIQSNTRLLPLRLSVDQDIPSDPSSTHT